MHSTAPVRPVSRSLLVIALLAPLVPAADPTAAQSAAAVDALKAELAARPTPDRNLAAKAFASIPLTKADAAAARRLLWQAHSAFITKDRSAEFREKTLKDGKLEMPYFVKTFGKKPARGWSLWVSMHGGGGTPKAVNDQQWENQKKLYTLEEGVYLAPRAPTNTWNLWHEGHVDRLFGRLIEDWVVLGEVDPDRVYVMGYSAGGDGVYQLAPRMADHWAAAAMMAGHPNDASPLGLRNVPFALQVGGKDAAFNRNKIAAEWGEQLDRLRKADPDGYPHFVKVHEDKGHWMKLEDKVALPWMAKYQRNPVPKRVVWKQSSVTHDRLYWLAVPPGEAKAGSLVAATIDGQTVTVTAAERVKNLLVRLDDRMLDLDRPVRVTYRGKTLHDGIAPRTAATMARTLVGRGDPKLVFDAEVAVAVPPQASP